MIKHNLLCLEFVSTCKFYENLFSQTAGWNKSRLLLCKSNIVIHSAYIVIHCATHSKYSPS
jgi:hypothetical protein